MLPVLAFGAYVLALYADLERERYSSFLTEAADGLAARIDQEISNSITTLKVLATSDLLDRGDYADFHARAQAALRGTESFVLLLGLDYQQLLNTRVPYGTELGLTSDPHSVDITVQRRMPFVSDVFVGRVSGVPVFNITYPVIVDDAVQAVLVLTRNAADIDSWLETSQLDPAITAAIADGSGNVIVRTPAAGSLLGGNVAALLFGADRPRPTARWMTDPAGESHLVVTDKPLLADWTAIIDAPEPVLESFSDRSWLRLGIGGIALVMLSLLLALLFGRFLSRPIRRIAADAQAYGKGERVPARLTPLREANQVSEALAVAAIERANRIAHVELLMRELAHRAKNQLTIVQSLARLIARRSPDVQAFQAGFIPRLIGLGRSIDALIQEDWKGARLSELVSAQLGNFTGDGPPRHRFEGTDLLVRSSAAERLGMALHELATNASKYGAWSNATGTVTITCSVDAENCVTLAWRERGGPPVVAPDEQGFGRVLLDEMLRSTFDADVAFDYDAAGFGWTLTAPLEKLCDEPKAGGTEPS
ncbi:MAG: sensor histidine kinase [Alphaproteobacteria bacterium]